MEKSNTVTQEVYKLWISQNEHIVSFHEEEGEDYEQLVFTNQNEKMDFVFQKSSNGFSIQ